MYKDFEELRDIPARVEALRDKGVRVFTYDDGLHVSVHLYLACECKLAEATASSEELALRSIFRRLNQELKLVSVDEMLSEVCGCDKASPVELLNVLTEDFQDGTSRVSLHCASCGTTIYAAREEFEDEALAKVVLKAIELQNLQNTEGPRCLKCLSGEFQAGAKGIRHSGFYGGGHTSKYAATSIGIG